MTFKVYDNTRYGYGNQDVVADITNKVPRHVQIDELKRAYPNGRVVRNEFYIGSLSGEAGQSLKIDIDPMSPNFMRGKDFNTHEGIGGITKILMAAYGWNIKQVAEHFDSYIAADRPAPPMNPININLAQQAIETAQQTQIEQPRPKRIIDANTPHDGEYLYLSEDGEILVAVRRYIERDETGEIVLDAEGNAKKEFRQFPRLPETRPLYNLPDIAQSDRIIWVEGEKCADALTKLGYTATCTIGGAGMLSANTKHKFDFSPLHGKELVIWPDNDQAGMKLAKLVQELAVNAGVKSVTMLTPPQGKPKKWDAADAIDEGFDIGGFLKAPNNKVKKTISLKDGSLLAKNQFAGPAPVQQFLIGDTIPLGVPVVFAAAGDSGKGMMTLDLAMKVASGKGMQNSFGGLVAHHGSAIILSAEDDRGELHRRIERLDPMRERENYLHELFVIPLPNEGGVFPIMMKADNTYMVSPDFDRLYEQILEMDDLALIIVDPLASFVHADVNADPAAGAAFMGLLAQIATETGATVMVNHHMAKIKDNEPITTPEQARNLIRGTSAIVDGVRCAFAVWQVEEGVARARCKDLQIPYTRNAVFDGAVVKSNGPANREIRNFVRDPNTGLLEDRSQDIANLQGSNIVRERIEFVYEFIRLRELEGKAVTKGGATDGIFESARTAEPTEPCIIAMQSLSESTVKQIVTKLQNMGRVDTYRQSPQGAKKWLGVSGGPLDTGVYQARTGRENI